MTFPGDTRVRTVARMEYGLWMRGYMYPRIKITSVAPEAANPAVTCTRQFAHTVYSLV